MGSNFRSKVALLHHFLHRPGVSAFPAHLVLAHHVCFRVLQSCHPLTRNCGASHVEFFQPRFPAPQMLRFVSSGYLAYSGSPLGYPCFGFVKVFIVRLSSLAESVFGEVCFSGSAVFFHRLSRKSCHFGCCQCQSPLYNLGVTAVIFLSNQRVQRSGAVA